MTKALFTHKEFAEAQEPPGEDRQPVELPPVLVQLRQALGAGDADALRDVVAEAAPMLYALQIDSGFRCLNEVAKRNLGKETVKNLVGGGSISTASLRELARALAEAAPSTFNLNANFPMPEPGEKCPMCGQPEDGRDFTGFDDVPGGSPS